MSRALGMLVTNLIIGRDLGTPTRDGCALAATVREWIKPARGFRPAAPPAGCLLQTHRDLAERLVRGLEGDRQSAAALAATELLLSDAHPRLDDLRRVVYLVEAA